MVCQNCQKEIALSSNFCYYCGAKQTPAGAPPSAAVPQARKRLMRSWSDRKIAGVCGGLAEYFDLDPTLLRVVWVLLVLCAGTGLLAYIVMWIVVPSAPPTLTAHAAPAP